MGEDVVADNEVTVEYRVSYDHVTKADIGTGAAVNYVAYAVYLKQENVYTHVSTYQPVAFTNGNAVCPVVLAKDQTYRIVFVAQHYESNVSSYQVNFREKKLEMPQTAIANSENYDLFYKVSDIVDFKGHQPEPVELKRIVAQVNLFCSQENWNEAYTAGHAPQYSDITIKRVPANFNLMDGTVSSNTITVTYSKSTVPGNARLAYAYCLADSQEGSADLEVKLYNTIDDNEPSVISSTDIPVERNKKTNINCAIL